MPLGDDSGPEGGSPIRRVQFARSLSVAGDHALAPVGADFAEENAGGQFDIMRYWQFVWKHRWIFIVALAVALAIAATLTLLTTPVYTARTTIEIDREAAKVMNTQDVTPREEFGNGMDFYQTQYGLLKSRALAERVVDTENLTASPTFLHATGLDRHRRGARSHDPAALREGAIRRVQGGLSVNPTRGSRLVQLSFNSTSPQVATQLANAVAENFIGMNLERRFESSAYAREFLQKQIALAKDKLEASERAEVTYAIQQNIIKLHEGGGGVGPNGASNPGESLSEADLGAINLDLAAATATRIAAQEKWLQARSTGDLGVEQVLASPVVQELSKEKVQLQAQYEENLRLYKPEYPVMVQLKAQIDETDRQIQSAANTIRQSLYRDYLGTAQQEKILAGKVNQLQSDVLNLKERSITYNTLQRDLDTNRVLYDGLLQRYKEVGVTAGVTTNNISIVDRAETPRAPSKPKPMINAGLALVFGLALGGLGAFVAEAMDQAIRRPADVEAKLRIPLLGSVPLLTKGVSPEEAMKDPRSPFWEAYFSIRTALQFSTTEGIPRSLLVVSTRPGEGKTTTSIALAHSLARLGARTLLVDADLRKPSVAGRMGLKPDVGLSNYLTGSMTLDEITQPSAQDGLTVITSGPQPPTPAELLADSRLRMFISQAEERYDVVIVDGPPVMGLADAPLISSVVAGTILVVETGKTGRGPILAMLHRLRMARAKVLGAVLAKFDVRKVAYGYGYNAYGYEQRYGYGYGNTDNDKKLKKAGS
jgi:succinoglycan biosynthesis transport protein ExoP